MPTPEPPSFAGALRFVGLGLELAAVFCAPVVLGYWLDGKWGSQPWVLLSGTVLGVLGGVLLLTQVIKRFKAGD